MRGTNLLKTASRFKLKDEAFCIAEDSSGEVTTYVRSVKIGNVKMGCP